jgi:hypothetical protein
MDIKVYKKETVSQPLGDENVFVPDIIDIIPQFETIDGVETITNCEIVEGRDEIEQACALATIFQKGLDPLDLDDGIRWSQAIREEISVMQLIQDIIDAVNKVTSSVKVVFDTVEDENGNSYLSYKLLEVA